MDGLWLQALKRLDFCSTFYGGAEAWLKPRPSRREPRWDGNEKGGPKEAGRAGPVEGLWSVDAHERRRKRRSTELAL